MVPLTSPALMSAGLRSCPPAWPAAAMLFFTALPAPSSVLPVERAPIAEPRRPAFFTSSSGTARSYQPEAVMRFSAAVFCASARGRKSSPARGRSSLNRLFRLARRTNSTPSTQMQSLATIFRNARSFCISTWAIRAKRNSGRSARLARHRRSRHKSWARPSQPSEAWSRALPAGGALGFGLGWRPPTFARSSTQMGGSGQRVAHRAGSWPESRLDRRAAAELGRLCVVR